MISTYSSTLAMLIYSDIQIMITIVSKEKERVQFQPKIIEFVRGFEHYTPDEDVVFDELITGEFLNTLKEFYEGNEFDLEKLKVKDIPIKSKELATYLGEKNAAIFKPFYTKAEKNRSILPFVDLIQGADFLRAPLFSDAVLLTIAILLHCTSMSEFDVQKYKEYWNLGDKEITFPSFDSKAHFYLQYANKLSANYAKKLDALFNPPEEEGTKKPADGDQTLAQKIQEQLDQGFEFDDE